ncbi:MAG: tetratricopeptide repeat-containing glycosyltransferase family protein [Rhodospirillaceae bacterium]
MSGADSGAALVAEARRQLAAGDLRGCERLCRAGLQQPGTAMPPAELSRLLARALHGLKRSTEAVLHQRRAARASGEAADFFALGVMELASGMVEPALAAWRQTLVLDPGHAPAARNLGLALAKAGRFDEAAMVLAAAEARFPGDTVFPRLLADAHAGLGRTDLARADYHRALALDPGDGRSWFLAGLIDRDQGRFEAALDCFSRAVAVAPDCAAAHVDLGQMRLLLGDCAGGWPEWEWRESNHHRGRPLALTPPRRLRVYAEQGHGDTIQFCRILPRLAALGFEISFQCHPPLVGLMRSLAGVARVLGFDEDGGEGEEIGLLSLPLALGLGLEGPPGPVPYLSVAERPVAGLVRRRAGGGPAVGLVWAGNPAHRNDGNRSCPFSALAPLRALARVDYYSLQVGPAALPAAAGADPWLTDLAPRLSDFADTAAAIQALDLVIAVDTATAHLAGALGRPVWLLLPWVPDWRWQLARADCPWYPGMTLFRQRAPGDWAECLERVASALAHWKPPSSDP